MAYPHLKLQDLSILLNKTFVTIYLKKLVLRDVELILEGASIKNTHQSSIFIRAVSRQLSRSRIYSIEKRCQLKNWRQYKTRITERHYGIKYVKYLTQSIEQDAARGNQEIVLVLVPIIEGRYMTILNKLREHCR